MIGGRSGHPGPKMIPAEAAPAVIIRTSNKALVKTIFFIFLPPLIFSLNQETLYLFKTRRAIY
jgi:hypothetical protein